MCQQKLLTILFVYCIEGNFLNISIFSIHFLFNTFIHFTYQYISIHLFIQILIHLFQNCDYFIEQNQTINVNISLFFIRFFQNFYIFRKFYPYSTFTKNYRFWYNITQNYFFSSVCSTFKKTKFLNSCFLDFLNNFNRLT